MVFSDISVRSVAKNELRTEETASPEARSDRFIVRIAEKLTSKIVTPVDR